jgi:acyl-CoA synthetase (AMP-forming)/AMP-acid ligase II
MISHRNVIANILQVAVYEAVPRKANNIETQNTLGILPFSHIYGLTLVAHVAQFRGDQTVVLPKFELKMLLNTIQTYKLEFLPVVPPMLIQIITNRDIAGKYDLSSVRLAFSGAAPLGVEVIEDLAKMFPKWKIGQGYGTTTIQAKQFFLIPPQSKYANNPGIGMTEASPVVSYTSQDDLCPGSSGSFLPGFKAKIIDMEGNEITAHDQRGELIVQSPSVVLGYLNNEKANAETFVHLEDGRWLKTGDEALIRPSSQAHDHLFITDRIKELIKVKVKKSPKPPLQLLFQTNTFFFLFLP